MNHLTKCSLLFVLVPSLLLAQDTGIPAAAPIAPTNALTLSREAAAPFSKGTAPQFSSSLFQISTAEPDPLPFAPSPQGPNPQPSAQNAPKKANWARRHVLLLSGLAMTGAGAAMVSTGGNGNTSGCAVVVTPSSPFGQTECTTVSTWGGSGRHIGGLLLLCVGVPVTILGIFKHS